MTASTANLWAVAGLVYALAGASLLALSVFAVPQPAGAPTERTLHKAIGQWLDGRIGAALIVAGFFLQMTGSIGTPTLNAPAVFVLLALALAAGYYGLSKDLLIDRLASAKADVNVTAAVEPRRELLDAPTPPPTIVVVAEPEVAVVETETVVIDLRPRESTG